MYLGARETNKGIERTRKAEKEYHKRNRISQTKSNKEHPKIKQPPRETNNPRKFPRIPHKKGELQPEIQEQNRA